MKSNANVFRNFLQTEIASFTSKVDELIVRSVLENDVIMYNVDCFTVVIPIKYQP